MNDQRRSKPEDQEPVVHRSPNAGAPTRVEEEHTAASSTQTSSGLAGGSPAGGPQKTPEREEYEKRERGHGDDPVMPADDSTLNTKI
ncbi:MAG TPA: hypothetical protein VFK20_03850 [Vicinamibacterales bacterium]|nr:hypothetical protein [Vicinamibacterales bacterium]